MPANIMQSFREPSPLHAAAVATATTRASPEFGTNDIICGRHKLAFNNIGNRRFRVLVSMSVERYLDAQTKQGKSLVIASIVKQVRSCGARFLKWDDSSQSWVDLNDKQANRKVGHCIRDMASNRGRIAKPSKPSLPKTVEVQRQRTSPAANEIDWRFEPLPIDEIDTSETDSDSLDTLDALVSIFDGDVEQDFSKSFCTDVQW